MATCSFARNQQAPVGVSWLTEIKGEGVARGKFWGLPQFSRGGEVTSDDLIDWGRMVVIVGQVGWAEQHNRDIRSSYLDTPEKLHDFIHFYMSIYLSFSSF